MDRRQFLKGIAAVAAVPVVAQLPMVTPEPAPKLQPSNPIFKGELGRWDGARIIESQPSTLRDEYRDELAKWWAKSLDDNFFELMMKNG